MHDSFWVVAGAAAPVIALAEIVSLGDAAQGRTETLVTLLAVSKEKEQHYLDETKPVDKRRRRATRTGQLNMLLQVAILALALASLAVSRDVVPLVIVTIVQPIGLFLLLVSAWMINLAYRQQQAIKLAYLKDPPASSKDSPAG